MKANKLCGLLLASTLLLCGCGATKDKDGKELIAGIKDYNISADHVYSDLTNTSSGSSLFEYIMLQIVNKNFPVDKDMNAQADTYVTNITANYKNQYGDDYEAQLNQALAGAGYDSIEAYRESLIQSIQYSEFVRKYVKENFDETFEDYYKQAKPRMISIIKVSIADFEAKTEEESSKLKEVEALLKTEKSFGDIAKDYSDDNSAAAKGSLGIIDKSSNLSETYGEDFEDAALSLKQGERSKQIKGSDGYYYISCTSTDKETLKNELSVVDISSPLLDYDSYIVYLAFNSYKLEYKDEKTKKLVTDFVNEALKEREEERK